MSKISKLINNPILFFQDAYSKRYNINKKIKQENNILINTSNKSLNKAFLLGFGKHKVSLYTQLLKDYSCYFIDLPVQKQTSLSINKIIKLLLPSENDIVVIWGKKDNVGLEKRLRKINVKVFRIEDAFIRSLSLGGHHSIPLSYILDKKGIYFDSNKPSELEDILNTYDFKSDKLLIQRAKKCINKMLTDNTSKYNYSSKVNIEKYYGEKTKKRVLVIGQVEDDASIEFGCDRTITNNDLVILAALENKDAQIIYKPHPDVLTGQRKRISDPSLVESISLVLYDSISIGDALETIDHVYTITSLTGFEALLRGIKVTTIGCPFYSGWGLTDERQHNDRRKRKLTVEEIYAGAYILYSNYINPYTSEPIEIEEALDLLDWMRDTNIEGYDVQGKYSSSSTIISKIKEYIEKENYINALNTSNLAVASYGDINSYIYRIKSKLSLGMLESSEKDLIYASQMSRFKNKTILIMYAKYLWEFKGFNKTLNSILSKLLLLDIKNSEKELIASMYCDGGYYKKSFSLMKEYSLDSNRLTLNYKMSVIDDFNNNTTKDKFINLYDNIVNDTQNFEEIIKTNSSNFCIVGNSPKELHTNNGEKIDNFKHVIRFNAYDLSFPYNEDYGNKTTIWVRMPKNMLNFSDIKKKDLDLVIISGSNWISRLDDGFQTFISLYNDYNNIGIVPLNIYTNLVKELKSPPSAGLQILYWIYCLTGPIPTKQIYGFELTDQKQGKDTQYNSNEQRYVRHNWQSERILFEKIIKG